MDSRTKRIYANSAQVNKSNKTASKISYSVQQNFVDKRSQETISTNAIEHQLNYKTFVLNRFGIENCETRLLINLHKFEVLLCCGHSTFIHFHCTWKRETFNTTICCC
jgi:hypothetical protein